MKKILLGAIIIFGAFVFTNNPEVVFAHPGNTAADGKHYCKTNCSYWGEVYGQRHGHGGYTSSFSPSSYSYPSYESSYISSNSDCPAYGFAYVGSCYELPSHAHQSIFSGFDCDYGYEKVGYGLSARCLADVDHGHYIGTSLFCDYGYEKYYNSCIKDSGSYNLYSGSSNSSSNFSLDEEDDPYEGKEFKYYYFFDTDENEIEKRNISSQCKEDGESKAEKPYFREDNSCYYCNPGYITDQDEESCYAMADVCESVYGQGSVPVTDGECECGDGYSLVGGQCKVDVDTKATTTNAAKSASDEALLKQIEDLLALIAQLQSQVR